MNPETELIHLQARQEEIHEERRKLAYEEEDLLHRRLALIAFMEDLAKEIE